jgi:uncharacterized membrane protein YfhO
MDKLISKPEFYFWYLLPTIIGLLLLIWTTMQVKKKADTKNVCFTVSTYFLILLSQWVLVQMFFADAWPTFFPHEATAFSLILVTLQYWLNRQDKIRTYKDEKNTSR